MTVIPQSHYQSSEAQCGHIALLVNAIEGAGPKGRASEITRDLRMPAKRQWSAAC